MTGDARGRVSAIVLIQLTHYILVYIPVWLAHWLLGDLDAISKLQFSISFDWLVFSDFNPLVIMTSDLGMGNGLAVSSSNPLPLPILTQDLIYVAKCCH